MTAPITDADIARPPARTVKTLIALVNAKLEFQDDPEEIAPLNEAKRWLKDIAAADFAERKLLTEERVREVVRAAAVAIARMAPLEAVDPMYRARILAEMCDAIAARAAKELAGTVVTGEPSPAPDLSLQQHALDIVFDGPPGPTAGRFVEVEDLSGKSVGVGQWIDRCNGMWALRIPRAHAHLHPATANIGPADTAVIDEALEYTAARKPGAPIADIARIRAALTSGGGS